jgi:hypothetical protein
MAIDTIRKRASAAGWYWPTDRVDRYSAIESYVGISAAASVTPVPVGVPTIWGPTMHTPTHHLTAGTPGGGLSSRAPGNGLTIRRRR